MKKTYALLMSGAMLLSLSLTSCSGENTTGVETETNATEADEMGGQNGGGMTGGNSGAGSGTNSDTSQQSNTGEDGDTARTTTPTTDNSSQ